MFRGKQRKRIAERRETHDVDYLVGGLRISLGADSTTPGPRTHIENFIEAARSLDLRLSLFMASSQPGLQRFARLREGQHRSIAGGGEPSRLADLVRLGASVWSGLCLFTKHLKSRPKIIYERAAVYQALTFFHPSRKRAICIVESNGLMAFESANDRKSIRWVALASCIEKLLYRNADLVVCVSSNLKTAVAEFAGIPDEKIIVVRNAIPNRLVNYPQRGKNSTPTIGFAGSLVSWQQLSLLLEAAAAIDESSEPGSAKPTPLRIEIIGDGPEYSALAHRAKLMPGNIQVTLYGRLDQDLLFEKMHTWTHGYAGHAPSVSDGMYHSPLKLYEYAALGLPAICTRSEDAQSLSQSGMPIHYFNDKGELISTLREICREHHQSQYTDDWVNRVRMEHSWQQRVTTIVAHVDANGRGDGRA